MAANKNEYKGGFPIYEEDFNKLLQKYGIVQKPLNKNVCDTVFDITPFPENEVKNKEKLISDKRFILRGDAVTLLGKFNDKDYDTSRLTKATLSLVKDLCKENEFPAYVSCISKYNSITHYLFITNMGMIVIVTPIGIGKYNTYKPPDRFSLEQISKIIHHLKGDNWHNSAIHPTMNKYINCCGELLYLMNGSSY